MVSKADEPMELCRKARVGRKKLCMINWKRLRFSRVRHDSVQVRARCCVLRFGYTTNTKETSSVPCEVAAPDLQLNQTQKRHAPFSWNREDLRRKALERKKRSRLT